MIDPRKTRALAVSFAVLSLVVGGTVAARRPSRKQVCRQTCGAAIDACVTAGQRRRPCRRRTLRLCRKHGPEMCEVTTSTILPAASTTTTTVPATTSTTVANPTGQWRFTGDVDDDTCGDDATAQALRKKLWGSTSMPAHIDFVYVVLPSGPLEGAGCTLDPDSQLQTCRDDFRGIVGAAGLAITIDSTFEGGLGSWLAYDWTTADVPPFGTSPAATGMCTGLGTADQCCAQLELEARRPEACAPTCTPDGDFPDGTAEFTFSVGCVDATASRTCRAGAPFCGCRTHWSGKTAHASVIG